MDLDIRFIFDYIIIGIKLFLFSYIRIYRNIDEKSSINLMNFERSENHVTIVRRRK